MYDNRDKQERFTWEKTIVSICGEVEDFISFSTEFQTPTNVWQSQSNLVVK